MRPQPVIERSIEERLAWGRDIIGRLNLDVSNLDSLEAAVALRTLASFSNNLICGTVTHLSTHWSELDNIRFPLTKFSIEPFAAAIPIEEPQVEVRFLGGEIDGRNYRTEATPEVASGDRVCVLINDVGGKHWLTGINAYLEIRDGIVGLGQVRSDTATFIAAFSDLVNER